MEHHGQRNDAVVKDAQMEPSREEYAKGMEQRSNYAAKKDVPNTLRKEESALSMEQRRRDAALKDALIKMGLVRSMRAFLLTIWWRRVDLYSYSPCLASSDHLFDYSSTTMTIKG